MRDSMNSWSEIGLNIRCIWEKDDDTGNEGFNRGLMIREDEPRVGGRKARSLAKGGDGREWLRVCDPEWERWAMRLFAWRLFVTPIEHKSATSYLFHKKAQEINNPYVYVRKDSGDTLCLRLYKGDENALKHIWEEYVTALLVSESNTDWLQLRSIVHAEAHFTRTRTREYVASEPLYGKVYTPSLTGWLDQVTQHLVKTGMWYFGRFWGNTKRLNDSLEALTRKIDELGSVTGSITKGPETVVAPGTPSPPGDAAPVGGPGGAVPKTGASAASEGRGGAEPGTAASASSVPAGGSVPGGGTGSSKPGPASSPGTGAGGPETADTPAPKDDKIDLTHPEQVKHVEAKYSRGAREQISKTILTGLVRKIVAGSKPGASFNASLEAGKVKRQIDQMAIAFGDGMKDTHPESTCSGCVSIAHGVNESAIAEFTATLAEKKSNLQWKPIVEMYEQVIAQMSSPAPSRGPRP